MKSQDLTILCIGHNSSISLGGAHLIEVPRVAPHLVRLERIRLLNMASTPYVWFIDDDDIVLSLPKDYYGDETRYLYLYNGKEIAGGTGLWSSVFDRKFLLRQNFSNYLSHQERKEDFAFRKCLIPQTIGYRDQIIYEYLGSRREVSI